MWSEATTTIAPLAEPVSLDEAKEFLSIDPEEYSFDGLVLRFIAAARGQVEAVTGNRIMPQTVQIAARCWGDLELLPVGPVTSVVSVVWEDSLGVEQLLDPGEYELIGRGLSRGIRPRAGKAWPGGVRAARDAIRVTVVAGWAFVPPQLHTAMLVLVADQFAHRESAVVGTVAAKVPTAMQVESLLANFRIWG